MSKEKTSSAAPSGQEVVDRLKELPESYKLAVCLILGCKGGSCG